MERGRSSGGPLLPSPWSGGGNQTGRRPYQYLSPHQECSAETWQSRAQPSPCMERDHRLSAGVGEVRGHPHQIINQEVPASQPPLQAWRGTKNPAPSWGRVFVGEVRRHPPESQEV